uniref:Clade I nitrous oxide reductase n=1 Tax=Macrostomum lignano TaxID=282301 RepID=A0A1I8F313_9PLAT
ETRRLLGRRPAELHQQPRLGSTVRGGRRAVAARTDCRPCPESTGWPGRSTAGWTAWPGGGFHRSGISISRHLDRYTLIDTVGRGVRVSVQKQVELSLSRSSTSLQNLSAV